jgi:hypothetical protein
MLVVGAEAGPRGSNDYMIPGNTNNFFDRDAYDARRILLTETKEAIVRDINVRLLSTETAKRRVSIRNIQVFVFG